MPKARTTKGKDDGQPKFNDNGTDAEHLRRLFEDGILKMDAKPRQVLELIPDWAQYNHGSSFRSAVTRIRKAVKAKIDRMNPQSNNLKGNCCLINCCLI